MKQMTLKLKMYAGNVSIVNNNIEKALLKLILWFVAVLALLYFIFLGSMVKNIVERRSLEAQALTLSSQVGNLELTYLSLSNNVDLNLSYSLGFKETKPSFATRKYLGLLPSSGNIQVAQNDL